MREIKFRPIRIMKYYKFIPKWKSNKHKHRTASDEWFKSMWGGYPTFVGDNSICHTKFNSIEDGLEAAKLDKTLLREHNWEILECSCWGLLEKRIMIKTLYAAGYLNNKITKDDISEIYHFKESE